MERKWILISAVLHAAVLLGVGVAGRPASGPAPIIIEVSLISAPAEDLSGGDESALKKGESTPGAFSGQTMEDAEAGRKTESADEQSVTAGPEPDVASHIEPHPDDGQFAVNEVYESVPENAEAVLVRTSGTEPETRTTLSQDSIRTPPADIGEAADQLVNSMDAGGPVTQRQTTNSKPQTTLLAFTGNPSYLGGILARGTGTGSGTGPGAGTGNGAGTGPGAGTGNGAGTGTVTGRVRPEIVSMPEPEYPVLSRRLGEEGRVILKVKINTEGGVLGAEITDSSSYERLDRSALRAVKDATFRPAVKDGRPVTSERTVAYVFRLKEP